MSAQASGALVLFSGGQDSATCLAWALERFERVETVGFDYGQRHAVELSLRPALLQALREFSPLWQQRLGPDHVLDLRLLSTLSDSALTRDIEIAPRADGLPNTFVPGRNLLFITAAAALAYRRHLNTLVGGMCETDYSGYPDCRAETMQSLQQSLRLGMGCNIEIATPLMQRDKAATWALAETIGGAKLVELIRIGTHTCYLGNREMLHDWGYGCASCPACVLRANGYRQFVARA
jgi:7-cyano-7-deazaguanine synthase